MRIPDGSEPASASVSPKAISFSPEARPGSHRSCCSGVPATWIGIAPSAWTARMRPGRRADAAELLDGEAQRQQVRAQAAVALLERDREDVVLREQAADVLGPGGGPVDLRRTGRDPLVGEHPDGVAQEHLLLGQAHGAVAGLLGGHRGHPSSGIARGIRPSGSQIVRDDIGDRLV